MITHNKSHKLTAPMLFAMASTCTILVSMLTPSLASASEFWLSAGSHDVTMPNGQVIPMWGYALEPDGDFATLEGVLSSPGPELHLAPGDDTLTIHLFNRDIPEAVSLVIPGLPQTLDPVFFTDAEGRRRVRSFAPEVQMGQEKVYQWDKVVSGTYLYHSGTHPAVQVQMGLYGACLADIFPGVVYPGVAFDREITLLFSEIDPALHAAIDNGTYGTAAFSSTIAYHPEWYLVNGKPFTPGTAPLDAGNINDRVLLRLLNGGLQSMSPSILGGYLTILAEDGAPYTFTQQSYSINLAPQKTKDVMMTRSIPGRYPMLDRRLRLTNADQLDGGHQVSFQVESVGGEPIGGADFYTATNGDTLAIPAPGVLSNDMDPDGDLLSAILDRDVRHGVLVLQGDGSFVYTANINFDGIDTFVYHATDGTVNSPLTLVSIVVAPSNRAPIAQGDSFEVLDGETLVISAPGILSNDSDPDGDALTAQLETGAGNGNLVFSTDGGFSYTPDAGSTQDVFVYSATDGTESSNPAAVMLTVLPINSAPVAVSETVRTQTTTPVTISVLANDTDTDGNMDPSSVLVVTLPRRGTVEVLPTGEIVYSPIGFFRGTDAFTYQVADTEGLLSNSALVRVNIVR